MMWFRRWDGRQHLVDEDATRSEEVSDHIVKNLELKMPLEAGAVKPKVNYVMSANSFLPLLLIFPFFMRTVPSIQQILSHVPFPQNGISGVAHSFPLTQKWGTSLSDGTTLVNPKHQDPKV